ncbi:MAG: hypothetical protein ABSG18_18775 [Steroidobacteraceae bacterium]|jgi:hypothetical protein
MRGLAVWLALLVVPAANALDWSKPWSEPQDAAAARDQSDEYAWRLFIALNWPADPIARTADRASRLGAERPVVWETWQSAGDVYLEDGADPGPWQPGRRNQAVPAERRFETFSLKDLPNARHIVGGVMVPLVDPLASARRLTEIRLNRATFQFIRSRELYNVDGQLRAVAAGRTVSFPYGAKEVKAKWRPISPAERSRYHTLLVTLADGTQRLYGLTALHIASKDLPTWFWATFEHVDNPSLPDGEGWQLPSRDAFACRGEASDCNRAPRDVGLAGTVWQYYRLRGTMTRFVDAAGVPQRLANSELEAGFQATASCITCHSRASIGIRAGALLRLPIFDLVSAESDSDVRGRRGFTGAPQAEWFAAGAEQATPKFQPLDFVWSLSKARPKKVSNLTAAPVSRNIFNDSVSRSIALLSNSDDARSLR